jgi:L-fuculose-phosphate aldolase
VVNDEDETALRQALADQYRHVERIGLNELASGNLSCRFGAGMLISPTGATAATISPETIVAVGLDGAFAGGRRPSSEWRMHAEIYRRHPAAQAVVHTHSDHCVALSCHNRPLPGFHYLVGVFGGSDVPCVPYSTFGGEQLALDAAEALADRTACLLGSHGMICRGANLAEAVSLAHRLEIMCRQYLLARRLGEPAPLSESQWREFFERYAELSYGSES